MKPTQSISTIALQQFCNGENYALSTLYKSWLPELYLVAYRYVQSQQEAEDVVADCFEKVFAMPIKKRHQKFIEEEITVVFYIPIRLVFWFSCRSFGKLKEKIRVMAEFTLIEVISYVILKIV